VAILGERGVMRNLLIELFTTGVPKVIRISSLLNVRCEYIYRVPDIRPISLIVVGKSLQEFTSVIAGPREQFSPVNRGSLCLRDKSKPEAYSGESRGKILLGDSPIS